MIDSKPAVLIADLPDQENEHFQLVPYGLYALRHTRQQRPACSSDFRVPADNLLKPAQGDGLTIAYHGLNLGRLSLCATAAGSMRRDAGQHAAVGRSSAGPTASRSSVASWSSGASPGWPP